jgi:hypothetical protein
MTKIHELCEIKINNIIMSQPRWCPNFLCLVGLAPLFVYYAFTGSLVACVLTVNGIAAHLCFPGSSCVKFFDAACNAGFAGGVSLVTMNYFSLSLVLFAGTSFLLNSFIGHGYKQTTHLLAFQIPVSVSFFASGFFF